jgi:hypothetical protein
MYQLKKFTFKCPAFHYANCYYKRYVFSYDSSIFFNLTWSF